MCETFSPQYDPYESLIKKDGHKNEIFHQSGQTKWDTQDEWPIPIYGEDPDSDSQLADLKHGVDWFESESSVAGLTRTKQGMSDSPSERKLTHEGPRQ